MNLIYKLKPDTPYKRDQVLIGVIGLLFFLPFLGNVGLWDPWEGHYAEVARQILERGDWISPFWKDKFFYSKPIGIFWMMALSMKIFGISEWALRLPFVLSAIIALMAVYDIGHTLKGRKLALLATFILGTMPQFHFIAKQAMPDMPLVATLCVAMASLLRISADNHKKFSMVHVLFYGAMAVGTLLKGMLGFAIPGMFIFFYCLLFKDWSFLKQLQLKKGLALFCLIALPWYIAMSVLHRMDFLNEFFGQHHFNRVGMGVHGDRGNFSYFIEQLGFAMYPWAPLAFLSAVLAFLRLRPFKLGDDPRFNRNLILVTLWTVMSYLFFTITITKFHHYIFPALPGFSLLTALLWMHLFEELQKRLTPFLAGALWLLFIVHSRDICFDPYSLTKLFVYNYERPFPEFDKFTWAIGAMKISFTHLTFMYAALATVTTIAMLFLYIGHRFNALKWLFLSVAFLIAGINVHGYFNIVGPHWTQKTIFETYQKERKKDEPIAAYLMNWRGETFYSRNSEQQIKKIHKLKKYVEPKGREFIIVERKRFQKMKKGLPKEERKTIRILDKSSNKFYLVSVGESS